MSFNVAKISHLEAENARLRAELEALRPKPVVKPIMTYKTAFEAVRDSALAIVDPDALFDLREREIAGMILRYMETLELHNTLVSAEVINQGEGK